MTGTTAGTPAGAEPAARSGQAPTTGGFTHRQILTILAGLMMGMFLAALDQTIVASAIRTIGDDLHGLSIQAWVTTAYLITSTISTPLYGKLSDIYGRKPLFLIAITLFLIGSAASAFATSMYMLAAFRAFQGLGAGGLFSMALAIIGDIVAAARAGPLPGLLPRGLRDVERDRSGDRRLLRRRTRPSSPSPAGAGSSWSTCRSGRSRCSSSGAP